MLGVASVKYIKVLEGRTGVISAFANSLIQICSDEDRIKLLIEKLERQVDTQTQGQPTPNRRLAGVTRRLLKEIKSFVKNNGQEINFNSAGKFITSLLQINPEYLMILGRVMLMDTQSRKF